MTMTFLSFYFSINYGIQFTRDPSEISGSSGYYGQETQAMGRFGIPRNTLRDYIGIFELRRKDSKRYKRVVEAKRQRLGKVSFKSIELRRRAVLNEYRVQSND